MNIDTAFACIYGRAPNPEETAQFHRIAKELDIRDNDAIWAVVFLFGHYLDLAKQMPGEMDALVKRSLEQYEAELQEGRKRAEGEFLAAKARVEQFISRTVAESAQQEIAKAAQAVARHTAQKSWLQWLGGAALGGMLALALAFTWGYRVGNEQGYIRAANVNAVSSWAATDLGQAAYAMDRNGDLQSLIACDRPGWKIERSRTRKFMLCIVEPSKDGSTYGWELPGS